MCTLRVQFCWSVFQSILRSAFSQLNSMHADFKIYNKYRYFRFTFTKAWATRANSSSCYSYLQPLTPMIASLANYNIVRTGSRRMTELVHGLDAVNIEWLGLNAKKHRISRIGDMKVGFLAFCSISSKCTESGFLPFAPVRYSSKASREGVEDLKKVNLAYIILYKSSLHSVRLV